MVQALLIGLAAAYVDLAFLFIFLTNDHSAPLSRRSVKFAWGSEKVRGVNIGGWLVLEP